MSASTGRSTGTSSTLFCKVSIINSLGNGTIPVIARCD
ncbi:hypothetical protein BPC006_I0107 [Burkholderia pseudomallei BPC006]|nr:hypothetical protein BPC006_I0107 [Burkholderia pseudomallei BPC006]